MEDHQTAALSNLRDVTPSPSSGMDFLRSLMRKSGQYVSDDDLHTIQELGDIIVGDTVAVLDHWNEWLENNLHHSCISLPPFDRFSSADICVAMFRFLRETDSNTHRKAILRRLARVLLHIFVAESVKELESRERNGEVFDRNGRKMTTVAHDLIIEKIDRSRVDDQMCERSQISEAKSYGKRWWRLGSGIGIIAILVCAPDVAASYIESRRFHDNALDLLINYMRNVYPTALAHFQSFDQILHHVLVDGSLAANHIASAMARPALSDLLGKSLPESPRWSNTQEIMTAATEGLVRAFKYH
ncbi:hypothetical protein BGW36DRAFT_431159 [Talaromyces proteolyticus]|uniref:Uncharacterized protein n=1 Tax=Talaromyces proteolyticus TaxID=1131652 RepID=A0AAD4PWE4_9EURO|nr:uncharacterized protein BGW36DRAFT_431159 [Talaromyces proteolyticus]KAH8691917.1 hypothetical protein BGW36DRAFT_431159 [Talaromyces proteolyticus]